MKIESIAGYIYVSEYAVNHIEEIYHSNRMNNFSDEDKKKLVLDKKKSKELSNLTFEEILNQKISMRTK